MKDGFRRFRTKLAFAIAPELKQVYCEATAGKPQDTPAQATKAGLAERKFEVPVVRYGRAPTEPDPRFELMFSPSTLLKTQN